MAVNMLPVYTAEDIAAHKTIDDMWIVIHGKVFNIASYLRDHPGGEDVLKEVAGTDATDAYDDVGHSEEATEVMQPYLIGTFNSDKERVRPKAVRLVMQDSQSAKEVQTVVKEHVPSNKTRKYISTVTALGLVASSAGTLLVLYGSQHEQINMRHLSHFRPGLPSWLKTVHFSNGGFTNGFLAASTLATTFITIVGRKLSGMLQVESGFTKYPPRIKVTKRAMINPHLAKGFLSPNEYKGLPLVRKDQLSPNVYRFVFALPNSTDVLGLPIGQHVAIKALIDGSTVVTRSYTPVSNNLDRGRIELVIKCYPDGLLTGKYIANLQLGDQVQFRGPKGAMQYRNGLCKRISMIAGGTGITPMYQLIRAICEDGRDATQISLIYANRVEEEILLRGELDAFAAKYPRAFKVWYMLDKSPEGWRYGTGYVTKATMIERLFPSDSETKVMLCGPPGMVNASKKALVEMGFRKPGAVSKISDQIFCF